MKAKMFIKTTWMLIFMGFLAGRLMAQDGQPVSTDFAVGYQLSQYQNDFGFGLNLTSPYFFGDNVAIRLRGDLMFLEHLSGDEMTWTPYSNFTLGTVGHAATIGDFMRLYGEGGVIAILPNDDFSNKDVVIGGYGLFGFEFFFFHRGNYFIEIGGAGSGATAEQVAAKPIYSNGMSISTGFRFHF